MSSTGDWEILGGETNFIKYVQSMKKNMKKELESISKNLSNIYGRLELMKPTTSSLTREENREWVMRDETFKNDVNASIDNVNEQIARLDLECKDIRKSLSDTASMVKDKLVIIGRLGSNFKGMEGRIERILYFEERRKLKEERTQKQLQLLINLVQMQGDQINEIYNLVG